MEIIQVSAYRAEEIAKIVKGMLLQKAADNRVEHLLLDSRKLIYPETSLFIALRSERRNAHIFIEELYQKGVRNFIISEEIKLGSLQSANIIHVKDSLQALHALVTYHRQQFDIPVIGITGSNGKTIVKEWLYQLLEPAYNIVRSPKSYNSQIGVPLSVWQMKPAHELAIFEAGISQPGEMVNLEKIIKPAITVFTNIGEAHNEGFLNIRQKINEKLVLCTHARVLIYCKDYPELNECILHFHNQVKLKDETSLKLFTWSCKTEADLRIISIDKNTNHTRIDALYEQNPIFIRIPFMDKGSIEDAIHCWCVLLWLGIDQEAILQRMETLTNIAMRLELKQAINNCSLINDSYNSDMGSLTIALDFLEQQKQHQNKTIILSDILQSGRSDAELYEEVVGLLEQKKINRLIGIGRNISREKNSFIKVEELKSIFFNSTEEFLQQFHQLKFQDETILLKGARSFTFERINRLLERKVHQTVLEIDLNAMAHNLKFYQSILKTGTKMMVMVKAFGYGSGSFEIANLLQFNGVDYLGVAYADEAVELRRAGITLPIMVMNPEPGNFDVIIQWKLEPEIYSLSLLRQFEAAIRLTEIHNFPVHIKMDTGMHRLGFEEEELPELCILLEDNPYLKVKTVFSHLAASDDPVQDYFTRQQADLFEKMSNQLQVALNYKFDRHIANSAAIRRHPQLHFDMVRLGLGLYGIDSTHEISEQLKQVSTLKTTISQIKQIPTGETIGYNRAGKAEYGKTIATVRIGYADGYMRRLGNGRGYMLLQEQRAPTIGNVCMDMLMLDVSHIPAAKEGDEVLVFGEALPVEQLADWAETIPYEILTNISQRVKRVYFEE